MNPSRLVSSIFKIGSINATNSSSENTFSSTWGLPSWCSLLPCSLFRNIFRWMLHYMTQLFLPTRKTITVWFIWKEKWSWFLWKVKYLRWFLEGLWTCNFLISSKWVFLIFMYRVFRRRQNHDIQNISSTNKFVMVRIRNTILSTRDWHSCQKPSRDGC